VRSNRGTRCAVSHWPAHTLAVAHSNGYCSCMRHLQSCIERLVDTVVSTLDVTSRVVMTTTDYSYNLSSSNYSMKGTGSDVQAIMNDVIGVWMTGCICLLGFAGNVVSFVVLKRAFGEQSPMFHVLRAMSVSDSVFLLAVFTVQSAVNAYQYFGLQHVADNFRGYVQYGVWPLLMTTQVRRKCILSVN